MNTKKPTDAQLLVHASRVSGRSLWSLGREAISLRRGDGKLSLAEYVRYGVYAADPSERRNFISGNQHWPLARKAGNIAYEGLLDDKWVCEQFLKAAGIPHLSTRAVIDCGPRLYPGTNKIADADGMREFALAARAPLFIKPNRGIQSRGCRRMDDMSDTGVVLSDGTEKTWSAFFEEFEKSGFEFLVQNVARPHPVLGEYASALPTLRLSLIRPEQSSELVAALLKIPAGENIADNFWRDGNVICELDPDTGRVLQARTQTPFGTEPVASPAGVEKPLSELQVPAMGEALALAHKVSDLFPMFRYVSLDIAPLDDGPTVVEVNPGGSFEMIQYATGRGFLTERVRKLLHDCGYLRRR